MTQRIAFILMSVMLILSPHAVHSDVTPSYTKTPKLAEWENLDYGMFIHFGMSTMTGREIDPGDAPVETYVPTKLAVRQWIETAKQAGMKYAVLTAKHVAGHCLWDSEDYDYDVANSPDKTDVVAEFMKQCRAYGIKPGIYYCVLDGHNENGVKWQASVDEKYFNLIKHHLTELHTQYPGIYEQWIDIPQKLTPEQRTELYRLVKKLSPDCIIMMNQGFRDGVEVPMTAWPTDLLNGERTLPPAAGHNSVKQVENETYYLPMEVCDTIGNNWFYIPNDPPKSTKHLYQLYSKTVGRGANLLLNVPPDKTGQMPAEHVNALMELKKIIDNPSLLPSPDSLTFDRPAAASNVYKNMNQYGPEYAVDDDPTTRWATNNGVTAAWLEVDLGNAKKFNRAMISEGWDRTKEFELQTKYGQTWHTFFKGTTIGQNLKISFEPVTARRIRLNILEATDGPTIWEFQVFETDNN
jgi:alpha-L-fucosidase